MPHAAAVGTASLRQQYLVVADQEDVNVDEVTVCHARGVLSVPGAVKTRDVCLSARTLRRVHRDDSGTRRMVDDSLGDLLGDVFGAQVGGVDVERGVSKASQKLGCF